MYRILSGLVLDLTDELPKLIKTHWRNGMIKRKASAIWNGGLKDGKGTISTDSGVLSNTQYSFSTRFEEGKGTNPEELIGAAHAGCYSMALSASLEKEGIKPESVSTTATVVMEKQDAGFTVTEVILDTKVRVPGADENKIRQVAEEAKKGCPISRVLNAKITLNTNVETAAKV